MVASWFWWLVVLFHIDFSTDLLDCLQYKWLSFVRARIHERREGGRERESEGERKREERTRKSFL